MVKKYLLFSVVRYYYCCRGRRLQASRPVPGDAQKRKGDGIRNGAKENKVSRGITDVEPRGSTREC